MELLEHLNILLITILSGVNPYLCPMATTSQIIKHIKAQIEREVKNGGKTNICSWQNREGVVISVEDAKHILKLIEKKKVK